VTNNHLPKDVNGNPIYLDGFSSRVNNLTVYYEANGFSSRISQRYRSPFTASTRSVLQGTQSNTQFQAEKQIDLQLAYAFTSGSYKGMSLLFQVINLTDAPSVTTRGPELIGSMGSKTGQLPWTYETVGRSVLLGASYKF
jgi:iron complex outermembrane receptor protein